MKLAAYLSRRRTVSSECNLRPMQSWRSLHLSNALPILTRVLSYLLSDSFLDSLFDKSVFLFFLKPEKRAKGRCRSLVSSQTNWITICLKVIMQFLPSGAKRSLPTPALNLVFYTVYGWYFFINNYSMSLTFPFFKAVFTVSGKFPCWIQIASTHTRDLQHTMERCSSNSTLLFLILAHRYQSQCLIFSS